MFSSLRQKLQSLWLVLAVIGPGIIAGAAGNDAGGIATYSIAGAHFGYSLLWAMLPVAIILIIIQGMCSRMGVVSGKGLADLIRESYGVKITFYILVGLLVANLALIISEFAGIAGSMEIFNIPRYISVPVGAFLIWAVIMRGSYRSAEKVFIAGAFIYVVYIISGFLAKPDWAVVFKNTVQPAFEFSTPYLLTLVAIVGTTIAPWMQFYLQASVVEKGVKPENYKYTKIDVAIGSIAANIIAFFIMVAAAATLFQHGIQIETASDAAVALAPFAGNFAEILFAVGLLNASLLGATIIPLATSHYICEGLGFEMGIDKSFKEAPWFKGIFTGLLVLGCIPALFPATPLFKVILVAQVMNGVLLIPVLIFILLLVNKKWLMGELVNKPWYNVIAWLAAVLLITLSGILVITGVIG